MPTPEKIALVHDGVANPFLVSPAAAPVWIATAGWQLADPADAQYLVPAPAPTAVDVITRDELDAALAVGERSTGWRDVTADLGIDAVGLLFLRRTGRLVEFHIDPSFNGYSAGYNPGYGDLNGKQLPVGFRLNRIEGRGAAILSIPVVNDEYAQVAVLGIGDNGYLTIFYNDFGIQYPETVIGRAIFITEDPWPETLPGMKVTDPGYLPGIGLSGGAPPAPQSTGWRDVTSAIEVGPLGGPGLVLACRTGDFVEVAIDPGAYGDSNFMSNLNGTQLPEAFWPSQMIVRGVPMASRIVVPLFADDATFQGHLSIDTSGVITVALSSNDLVPGRVGYPHIGRTSYRTDKPFPTVLPGEAADPT